jgi:F0F1-type ATP synthase delta subunit
MKIDSALKQQLRSAFTAIRKQGKIVEVISAYDLSESEKKALEKKFPMLEGAFVTFTVDTSILAGVIIKYGSKMIDLSLQTELTNLRNHVYERL